jgi:hypothetical protein
VGKSEGKSPLARPRRRWVILGWIFRNGMWDHGLDRFGPRQGQVAGTCEYGNEPSGPIKYGELFGYLLTG